MIIALVDQAIYAGVNLGLAVLLVGVAGVAALGRYALIYSVAAIGHSLIAGLVLDPLTTFGAPRSAVRLRMCYAHVMVVCGTVLQVLAVVMALISYMLEFETGFGVALGVLLFSAQGQLIGCKRLLYVSHDISKAAVISSSYAVAGATAAAILVVLGQFNEVTLVLCLSGAAVVSVSPFTFRIVTRKRWFWAGLKRRPDIFSYTAWAVATSLPAAAAVQSIYWVSSITSSIEAVGNLKLFEQIMMPVGQALGALMLLDQVRCASAFSECRYLEAFKRVDDRMRHYAFIALAYAVLAVTAVYVARAYGYPIDDQRVDALAVYGCGMVAFAAAAANNIGLKMSRRPQALTLGYSVMAVFILSGSIWIEKGSLVGLATLVTLGWSLHFLVLVISVRRIRRAYVPAKGAQGEGPRER